MAGLGPQVVQVLDFATARAPELQALHELAHHARMHTAVDDKLVTQRNQRRRRANAFKSHQMPRRLREPVAASEPQEEELIRLGKGRGGHLERAPPPPVVLVSKAEKARAKKQQGPRCRKHRRRMYLLLEQHSWGAATTQDGHGEEEDGEPPLETAKWLATHAWHAKRMRMNERYGHMLAQHRQDKSVSAALTAMRTNATLHDMSYYGVLELYGSAKLILEALQLVADPSGSDFDEVKFLSGQQEGQCVLYHANQFPMGAIAPVTFMWRPLQADYAGDIGQFVSPITEDGGFPNTKRQLWLWIHPAAFMEAASAISNACQEAMAEYDEQETIEILDRRGHVARLQLRGKRADSMLNDVLKKAEPVVTAVTSADDHDDGFTSAMVSELTSTTNLTGLQQELRRSEMQSEARVHSVQVQDPRQCSSTTRKDLSKTNGLSLLDEPSGSLVSTAPEILCPLSRTNLLSGDAEEPDSALILAQLEALLKWTTSSNPTEDCTPGHPLLYPYVSPDCVKSTESGEAMEDENSTAPMAPCSVLWSAPGRDNVRRSFCKDHELNSSTPSIRQRECMSVSLLLVRKTSPFPGGSGWDVVLSPVHAPAFLNAFVFKEAMVIGLDEHEALSTVAHEASFPRDFPDTDAGQEYWQHLAQDEESEYVKKPKAKRIAYEKLGVDSPFQPNWGLFFGLSSDADSSEEPSAEDVAMDEEADENKDGDEETQATKSVCVLRGASYMEPFPFSRATDVDIDNETLQLIPVAIPTLVRVALSFPRRGNVEPCSMIYLPSNTDVAKYLENPKWSGRDYEAPSTSEDQLELMGFVTSAVYDRPKGAFRGTAFCSCEPLQRLAIALKQQPKLPANGLLALTRTPSSRQLRPVLLHVQEA